MNPRDSHSASRPLPACPAGTKDCQKNARMPPIPSPRDHRSRESCAYTLKSIEHAFYPRYYPLADHLERLVRCARERLLGVDLSIFDPTIRFYAEVKGQPFTPREALARALDKQRHKAAWHERERTSVEDIMRFYTEVDVYPFRQPYLQRFGGHRWHGRLVQHIDRPRVLEYGCGSAVLTEYLLAKYPSFRFSVADIPSTTQAFVRWKKDTYDYPYTILTIGPGKEGIPLAQPYDLIICKDVLEHTPNPFEIVSAFVEHLSPGGVLLIDYINSTKGENLAAAAEQREDVKALLKRTLIPLKAIDEPRGKEGLYVKDTEDSAL